MRVKEYEHVGFGRYDWVEHVHCDRCRIEIPMPWLHRSRPGLYDDCCVTCYNVLYQSGGDERDRRRIELREVAERVGIVLSF